MVKNLPMSNGSRKPLEINYKLIVCEHFVMYNVFTICLIIFVISICSPRICKTTHKFHTNAQV